MRLRRGVVLTREGWYFLFVACFIIAGAVLRDVNLLVVLGGMMLGLLLLSWRISRSSLRGLEVRRVLPRYVSAGESFPVQLEIRNPHRRLPTWGVEVTDRLAPAMGSERPQVTERMLFPYLGAGERRQAVYRVTAPRRGRYRWSPAEVSTRFPLGLLRCWDARGAAQDTTVLPPRGRLSRAWRKLTGAEGIAQRVSRRRGVIEGEYYALREWRPGDSRRWVHWRTAAKLDRLAVLQFEQPQRQQLSLLLDLWVPSQPSAPALSLVELAVAWAATAVHDAGRRGNGEIVICVHGSPGHAWWGPAALRLCEEILQALALVQGTSEPVPPASLAELRGQLRHRPRMVVVSTRPAHAGVYSWLNESLGLGGEGVSWLDVGSEQLSQYFEL